jgi:hypothetical protein
VTYPNKGSQWDILEIPLCPPHQPHGFGPALGQKFLSGSLEQFRHFNLADYVCPFAGLLASHELIYFEIMLSILSKYNFSFHSITRHLIVHIIYVFSELVPTLV